MTRNGPTLRAVTLTRKLTYAAVALASLWLLLGVVILILWSSGAEGPDTRTPNEAPTNYAPLTNP